MLKKIIIGIVLLLILGEGLALFFTIRHYEKKLDLEYDLGYKAGSDIKREIIDNETDLNSIPAADFITMLGAEFRREYESSIDSLTNEIIGLVVDWFREQSERQDYRVYRSADQGGDAAADGGN